MTSHSDKELILTHIHEALTSNVKKECPANIVPFSRTVTVQYLTDCLATQCSLLKTHFTLSVTFAETIQAVVEELRRIAAPSIGIFLDHNHWPIRAESDFRTFFNEFEYSCFHPEETLEKTQRTESLSRLDVAITGVEALIAETGTVVLGANRADGRLGSLLVPRHWIIASETQIVATLEDIFPAKGFQIDLDKNSCLTLVSGPSRTADIEKQIVIGVHGPLEVRIFLFQSNPTAH